MLVCFHRIHFECINRDGLYSEVRKRRNVDLITVYFVVVDGYFHIQWIYRIIGMNSFSSIFEWKSTQEANWDLFSSISAVDFPWLFNCFGVFVRQFCRLSVNSPWANIAICWFSTNVRVQRHEYTNITWERDNRNWTYQQHSIFHIPKGLYCIFIAYTKKKNVNK